MIKKRSHKSMTVSDNLHKDLSALSKSHYQSMGRIVHVLVDIFMTLSPEKQRLILRQSTVPGRTRHISPVLDRVKREKVGGGAGRDG